MRTISKQEEGIYYKSFYNDTLYFIHPEHGINPLAVIDFGTRKYPTEAYFDHSQFKKVEGKILVQNVFVNEKTILFYCFLVDGSLWFICKYNKENHQLTYHSDLLLNDLDGGLNVFVSGLSDRVAPVFPLDEIEDQYKEKLLSRWKDSELKFPQKKERFNTMHRNQNPDDNPLLMIFHLKNN